MFWILCVSHLCCALSDNYNWVGFKGMIILTSVCYFHGSAGHSFFTWPGGFAQLKLLPPLLDAVVFAPGGLGLGSRDSTRPIICRLSWSNGGHISVSLRVENRLSLFD